MNNLAAKIIKNILKKKYNHNSPRKQCCTHVINLSFLHVLYVLKLKKGHSCAKYKFIRRELCVFVGGLVVFLIKKSYICKIIKYFTFA